MRSSSAARSAARSAPLIVSGVSIAEASERRSNICPQREASVPPVLRMIAAAYWPRTPNASGASPPVSGVNGPMRVN